MNDRRSRVFSIFILIAFVSVLGGLGYYLTKHPIHINTPSSYIQPGFYKVTKFDDGDTIAVDMDGHTETVRFIGVDTPETHDPRKAVQCYGTAAAAFTKKLIGNNPVRLEADALNTNRDRYNRLLRYIYLPDGRLVNAEIIKQGYGFAYLGFPFAKSDEFKNYQTNAMQQKIGLWHECNPTINQYGGYTSNDVSN